MRVERIKAKTMQEAMEKIKQKLGEDAVILNTRSNRDGIEVIAARDADEQPKTGNSWLDEVIQKDKELRSATNEPQKSVQENLPYDRKGYSGNHAGFDFEPEPKKNSMQDNIAGLEKLEEATRTAREFSDLLKDQIKSSQEQHKLWVEHEKQLDQLKKQVIDLKESILRQELIELKKKAQELESRKKNDKKAKPVQQGPDPALQEFYSRIREKLQDRGISAGTAGKLLSRVESYFNANPLDVKSQADVQRLKNMLTDGLAATLPILPSNSAKVVSVIGPHEAGKTSACLKIALKESLVYNKKVALVLFSTESEESQQHLQQLSVATKLPLAIISTTDELQKILDVHADKDLIIIDFAISDPTELKPYMNALPPSSVLLTLKSNLKLEELEAIREAYKEINYHALLLTHLDRLIKIGMVVEIAQLYQKPLSYISNGSQIPEDIEYANKTKLSHMILKG